MKAVLNLPTLPMTTRFGGIEGYVADGPWIDAASQQALRSAFVELN